MIPPSWLLLLKEPDLPTLEVWEQSWVFIESTYHSHMLKCGGRVLVFCHSSRNTELNLQYLCCGFKYTGPFQCPLSSAGSSEAQHRSQLHFQPSKVRNRKLYKDFKVHSVDYTQHVHLFTGDPH